MLSNLSNNRVLSHHQPTYLQLDERRKRKLGRLVPFEMRALLLEMLDCEPNLRPSANYALQVSISRAAAGSVCVCVSGNTDSNNNNNNTHTHK